MGIKFVFGLDLKVFRFGSKKAGVCVRVWCVFMHVGQRKIDKLYKTLRRFAPIQLIIH